MHKPSKHSTSSLPFLKQYQSSVDWYKVEHKSTHFVSSWIQNLTLDFGHLDWNLPSRRCSRCSRFPAASNYSVLASCAKRRTLQGGSCNGIGQKSIAIIVKPTLTLNLDPDLHLPNFHLNVIVVIINVKMFTDWQDDADLYSPTVLWWQHCSSGYQ